MLAKFNNFKPCQVCGKFIHQGDVIARSGGFWIHAECVELSEKLRATAKTVEDAHRSFLGISAIQYDVSYSIHDALRWALKNAHLSQELYEKIKKSPFYKVILDYVPD